MTAHWSWWASGLALTLVPVLHWLLLNRAVAVSGRYSALVDRLRFGRTEAPDVDTEALLAMLRAQTEAEFGSDALETPETGAGLAPTVRGPQPPIAHVLFLGGLALGGLASALLAGGVHPTSGLHGETVSAFVHAIGLPLPALLVLGGVFVGFGTRMAAGCTSGHGLCGVSQFQPGSLVATAGFFGAGVVTSFTVGAFL